MSSRSKGSQEPQSPDGDPQQIVGRLKWVITDSSNGEILSKGEKVVTLGDTLISDNDTDRGKLTTVDIPLEHPFWMSFSQSDDAKVGFGFTARRSDIHSFGWDWFTVNGDRATKLQEAGELAIEWVGTRIARTEFLTDVSLRISRMDRPSNPLKPEWRVVIEQGSFISWPQ